MPLNPQDPTQTEAWKKLEKHFEVLKNFSIRREFEKDAGHAKEFSTGWNNFFLDYSKNKIDRKTRDLLLELASEMNLKDAIEKQFTGDKINKTEDRAVLHTALRAQTKPEEVEKALQKMKRFSSNVIQGKWKGFSGKTITDVVNIGIGGSDLGPKMITRALQFYRNHLGVHFVSNIDGDQISEVLHKVDPETTLFIVVSKSFTTQETLTNAETAREWFLRVGNESQILKHFVAVSSQLEKTQDFGIAEENIFPMWDWVGGRFSLMSPAGISIACAIGFEQFEELLEGAELMDRHFRETDFEQNMPVLMALISVWYNNFYGCETEAVIPYSNYLDQLVPYLQQAVMESNGKSVSRNGKKIPYQTGTIVWGETGTNAQHAFFQLIHQGTKLIPCDFIGFKKSLHGKKDHHQKLMANFFAQTEALLKGKTKTEVERDLADLSNFEQEKLTPFKTFEGEKPTNTLLIDELNPQSLGSLIALYEHKLFVQGVIWNIFSYDQMGVELGKKLATDILGQFSTRDFDKKDQDASTKQLLKRFLEG
jgi:glucose-6-phosphate isomerase